MDDITSLTQLGSQPISAQKPAGTPVREDMDFDLLQQEVQKLSSITGGVVDWAEIVRLGQSILTSKSKDLLVASYLCLGLFRRNGYEGLETGLTLYGDLIGNFWETLYPEMKRKRGRISAISWLSEYIGKEINKTKVSPADMEILRRCEEEVKRITTLLEDKLAQDSPGLYELGRAIKDKIGEASVQVQEKVVKKSAPEPKTAAIPAEVASVSDAEKVLRESKNMILRVAAFFRKDNPENPIPYRLARSMLWDTIQSLPPNTNGKTQIPAIPPHHLESHRQLLDSGNREEILDQSESRFIGMIFWIDLQRHIDQAMSELGPSYQKARKTVREELGVILRRCPGLLDLKFQDGRDFADQETKGWVETEILSGHDHTDRGPERDSETTQNTLIEETIQEAGQLMRKKKIKEAIALFQEGLNKTSRRRERFMWRLNLARLCLRAGHPRLALPQLESLDEEINRFSLEEWEPDLCLDVITSLLKCQKTLTKGFKQTTPEISDKRNQLYSRLCRLDMLSALAFNGER
ncbi:MAG: type VI secretion system protein TssA [Nitrospinota bacterium]